jgi:phosphatidylinositol alpha-mannosyltransferase
VSGHRQARTRELPVRSIALLCPYDIAKDGGVQTQCRLLARHLSSQGHEVFLVAPATQAGHEVEVEGAQLVSAGPALEMPANSSRAPVALRADLVLRALREVAPKVDLFHIHEPLAPLVSMAATVMEARVPRMATCHRAGTDVLYKAAGFLLRSRVKRGIQVLSAVSRVAAATAEEALGRTPDAIIPNAIDLSEFDAARPPCGGHPSPPRKGAGLRVLFVGRHERRKGLEVALQAAARLAHKGAPIELEVIGEGPLTKELERRYSLPFVAWRGRLPRPELIAAYHLADVFVGPSLVGESFGVIVVEAAAAGCALVLSDLAGYREAAADAAVYFRPGSAEDLAKRLEDLLAHPDELERRRVLARRRAEAYDARVICRQYQEAYEMACLRFARAC